MNGLGLQPKISEITGRSLSAVVFVQDHVQFQFDGPCLTALTLPVFTTATTVLLPGSAAWRDGLCSAIGVEVASVRVTDEELRIEFANSASIAVSLRDEDYTGPEAINYEALDGRMLVV
jgi:hypothetical protein